MLLPPEAHHPSHCAGKHHSAHNCNAARRGSSRARPCLKSQTQARTAWPGMHTCVAAKWLKTRVAHPALPAGPFSRVHLPCIYAVQGGRGSLKPQHSMTPTTAVLTSCDNACNGAARQGLMLVLCCQHALDGLENTHVCISFIQASGVNVRVAQAPRVVQHLHGGTQTCATHEQHAWFLCW